MAQSDGIAAAALVASVVAITRAPVPGPAGDKGASGAAGAAGAPGAAGANGATLGPGASFNLTAGGTKNDVDLGQGHYVRVTAINNPTQITGIVAPTSNADGFFRVLLNTGPQLVFTDEDGASQAQNRIITGTVNPGELNTLQGAALFIYDGTLQRWVILTTLRVPT